MVYSGQCLMGAYLSSYLFFFDLDLIFSRMFWVELYSPPHLRQLC